MKRVTRVFLINLAATIVVSMSACMTYTGFPPQTESSRGERVDTSRPNETLYYTVKGNGLFNGEIGIRDVLEHRSPYRVADPVEAVPERGTYVRATVTNLPPSPLAGVMGYVSLSTTFIVPAWSTQDGYRVTYEVYKDGEKQRAFDYEFHRGTFLWLGMLPFVWVNLLTASEKEAFEATTLRFLEDAKAYWQA